MIVSRTPLRISFVGGGSDIPTYYKNKPGAVISTAINKYIYVTVNDNFDNNIRAKYSLTEVVNNVLDIKHPIIRECLKLLGIKERIEITSLADIPSRGTGLGSSSSFTVGLLNALYAYKKRSVTPEKLAREACLIEMDILKKPIGKQDQYIAAYGGFQYFNFLSNGKVKNIPIKFNSTVKKLEDNLILLYTGKVRKADKILRKQLQNMEENKLKLQEMDKMVTLSKQLFKSIKKGEINSFGEILEENWNIKKSLAKNISSKKIDAWYGIAKKNGAEGGKILGAGGGGFLLIYAKPRYHSRIIKALAELSISKFKFASKGSEIVFTSN